MVNVVSFWGALLGAAAIGFIAGYFVSLLQHNRELDDTNDAWLQHHQNVIAYQRGEADKLRETGLLLQHR